MPGRKNAVGGMLDPETLLMMEVEITGTGEEGDLTMEDKMTKIEGLIFNSIGASGVLGQVMVSL